MRRPTTSTSCCAIVGIELPIARLEGKLKASQDEAVRDRLGTVEGLRGLVRPKAAMADLILKAVEAERDVRS